MVLCMGLFLLPLLFIQQPMVNLVTTLEPERTHHSSYIQHVPFNISSDADFVAQGWPGNGSISDPFRIEGLNITNNESTLIWIRNTSAHFIIYNCSFSSTYAGFSSEYSLLPITMDNVSNCIFQQNRFIGSLGGMSIHDCRNMTISRNTFGTISQAISAREIDQSVIDHNIIGPNAIDFGIWVSQSSHCAVYSNIIPRGYGVGIQLSQCTTCEVRNNTIAAHVESASAISIFGGNGCNITRNHINATEGFWQRAIESEGSEHSFTFNCITNASIGLYLRATDCFVAHNNFTYCSQSGIELIISDSTRVEQNTVIGSSKLSTSGISVIGGRDQVILLNGVDHVSHGIGLQGSINTTVGNNTCRDVRYGIALLTYGRYEVSNGPSINSTISHNRMDGGGFIFSITGFEEWNFSGLQILGNKVNNQSILYCDGLSSAIVNGSGYGQIILMRCLNTTLVGGYFWNISSDITVYGYHDAGFAAPIHLLFSDNCTIDDVTTHENTIGIKVQQCTNIILKRCYALWCTSAGIMAVQSGELLIEQSDLHFCENGIILQWSWDSIIRRSSFSYNGIAVYITEAANCTISNCALFMNVDGLSLDHSDSCILWENDIVESMVGILLIETSNCLICKNDISACDIGIRIGFGSNSNWIYSNSFEDNDIHAVCLGTSNHWDDGESTGNLWDDYAGIPPYIIDEDDVDNFPISFTWTTTTTTTTTGLTPDRALFFAGAGAAIALIAILIILTEKRESST